VRIRQSEHCLGKAELVFFSHTCLCSSSKAVAIGGLHLLVGEAGSVLVERKNRTWKTWATDFMTRVKSLVGSVDSDD